MGSLERIFGDDASVLRDRDFQVLLLANLNAPLAISLISPLLDTLTGPFGVSAARIGLMITVLAAPSIVLIVLIGALTDRVGRKPVLVVSLLLFGAGGTAITLTTDFRVILALRLVQGIGYAGLTPVVITSLGDLYGGDEEVAAQGFRFTSTGVASTAYPLLAGVLVIVGWQYPFLMYAIAFPIALAVYRWFDEPTTIDVVGEGRAKSAYVRELLRLAGHPRVLPILLVRGFPPFIYFGFLTYVSFLVRVLGGTPQQAGILVSASSVAFAGTATQLSRMTALLDRNRALMLAHLLLLVGLVIQTVARSLVLVGAGVVAMGIGIGIAVPLFRSVITDFAPEALRGGLMSLGESMSRIAITAAPLALGIAISTLEPTVGFATAVRWTVLGIGIVMGGLGIGFVIASDRARALPPAE